MSLLLQHRDAGVLTLTLNDPDRRNPIGDAMRAQLVAALESSAADDTVRAIVITGADGVFSSGGDLASMPPDGIAAADARLAELRRLVELVAHTPKPVLAAVEGAAAGASVGIAASCDLVVASASAKFLLPFSRLGLFPDAGLIATLAQRVGTARARRLLLVGDAVTASTAAAIGLVDEVVAVGEALARARVLAMRLASRSPQSIAAVKRAYATGAPSLAEGLDLEAAAQRDLYFSADFAEGKAAFFERREPDFRGRVPRERKDHHGTA
jgi:enoyl-CoA hydratase/carnithine racemase